MKIFKTDWVFASAKSSGYLSIFRTEPIQCVNDEIHIIQCFHSAESSDDAGINRNDDSMQD
ncbi:hypothetical protein A2U01_0049918 [Trifolium medium]|uniref:Uncharacterized protein n=1 Tax=Trifolium medium TaxID=97028 RepID=A0A392QYW7_9FABA|nr:hypothetical protein [Trifolium medium]